MHPELVRIAVGPFVRTIYCYGALLLAGVVLAVGVAVARARRYRVERSDELAVALLGFAGGILGATLLYLGVHARELMREPALLLRPGLVFYGGVLGAVPAIWLYCRKFGVPMASALDAAAPGVALGHAVGRLGCLLGGCCYGRPCAADFPLGVWLAGARRHPVQLYEAVALLFHFALLLLLGGRLRNRPGALAALYLGGYALIRLAIEPLRGDAIERGLFWQGRISTSQAIAYVMILVALGVLWSRRAPALPKEL